MKKLILVALVAVFSSCSSDDKVVQDSLIGKWQLEKESVSTDSGKTFKENPITDCKKKSTLEFLNEGTYKDTPYALDRNEKCIVDGTSEGTWKKGNSSSYIFTRKGKSTTVTVAINGDLLSMGRTISEGKIERYSYKRVK